MRLDPAEVPDLPVAGAPFDLEGRILAATPEWRGAGPGAAVYFAGQGHLVVAPEVPTPELDALVDRLLSTLREAAGMVDRDDSRRIQVLAAGLELVAGRPQGFAPTGTVDQVLELALAAISSRTQDLVVEVAGPVPELAVPSPAALALAVTQFAVNAQQHDNVTRVWLRVAPGPTFYVEWPSSAPGLARIDTHRHTLRRRRWGWGYVQMVADALGATALPPGPTTPGRTGVCLGLGSVQLGLPLAHVRGELVQRSNLAWDQDPRAPGMGFAVEGPLAALVSEARWQPGRIVYFDLYRARARGDRVWLVMPPESGSSQARDLVRGLAHERALWKAPEPYATRLHGLATLLGIALGEPWPSVPPSVWEETASAAAATLGVSLPPRLDALVVPDPRLVAVLLAELEGTLLQQAGRLYVEPSMRVASSPLLGGLRSSSGLGIQVNPDRPAIRP